MAWTSPRTWTTGELVTAAMMNTHVRDNFNVVASHAGASNSDSRTFTNTSFADLDALTGGSGTVAAVSVSVATGTLAMVTVSAATLTGSGGNTYLSYRVSGATTIAAQDSSNTLRAIGISFGGSRTHYEDGLNAGTNVFELQARVTGGTGTITAPELSVRVLAG